MPVVGEVWAVARGVGLSAGQRRRSAKRAAAGQPEWSLELARDALLVLAAAWLVMSALPALLDLARLAPG
jgi:hypothetical protein